MFRPRPKTAKAAPKTGWRDLLEFDDHEFVMIISDEASGLRGFIGIHNTNRGPTLGGTRFKTYGSEEAALKDVLNLSRAMSYKCALADLPYGGAKGVVIATPSMNRHEVLAAYARRVDRLGGLFKTGTDVGISNEDVTYMAQYTSHMLGVVPGDRGNLTTADTAALGVFQAMKACLRQLYNSPDFHGRSVAIKGAGKLGGELARLVIEAGGTVLISDIDPHMSSTVLARHPTVQVVDNNAIHKQAVDIYAPCALGNEFTRKTVSELHCRAIAGGANNQLESDAIGDLLHRKNILYAPDYIANAGGLIYVADELESDGFKKERVLKRTYAIEDTVNAIFQQAAEQHQPTHQVADMIARSRIQAAAHE